jgi:hypothetical protein
MLKAQAMRHQKPIQLVLPMTYDPTKKLKPRPSANAKENARRLQDEATRAWNIHTALYYKANGTPGDWSETRLCPPEAFLAGWKQQQTGQASN